VPPYNYAHHRVVTPDTLSAEDKARKPVRESSAHLEPVGELA